MPQMLMEFAGVSKSYRAGIGGATRSVLSDCTSTIGAGESVGLMGASGSGKSTLGRILAGLERPDHGVIRFCGEDIYAGTRTSWKRFRRSVQMLFQDPGGAFHPMRRIDQSLKQVLELYGDSAANHDDTIRAMLFRVGLHGEVLFRYPDQISGGQAQRLALARLLLVHPRVIILDEPTSGLDISVQAQILHLLKDVQRTCCVSYFLISHDEEVIRFMTDRFYILTEGTLMSSE